MKHIANNAANNPTGAPPPATGQPAVAPPPDFGKLLEQFQTSALNYFNYLADPWALYQLAIILGAFLVSLGIARLLKPTFERYIRQITTRPAMLPFLVVLLNRMKWIVLAALLWGVTLALQQVTWPSRSYLIGLAASLVTVWVLISFASRLIKNRSLANLFAGAAWGVYALYETSLLGPARDLLGSFAVSVGQFRLSLLMLIEGVLLLGFLLWLASFTADFVERKMRSNLDLAPSLQVLLSKILKFTLLLIATLAGVSAIGIDLTALTVFSGALGLGIGFGLQKVASNLMSGVIILMDKSIKPGDVISLESGGESTFGWITSLRGRYVSVVTRDGVEYLIPNETFITERVVNWSFTNKNVRQDVRFGVSYNSDPHFVRKICVEALEPLDRVLKTPAPVCHVTGFGESSVDFILRFWINNPEGGLTNIRGQVYLAVWDTLKKHGIEIPYPHREVIMRPAAPAASGSSPDKQAPKVIT